MNIFIAHSYNNQPLGLILATNKEFAQVAFEAMDTRHHHIEEIDPLALPSGTNVLYLLTSKKKQFDHVTSYLKWIRGK